MSTLTDTTGITREQFIKVSAAAGVGALGLGLTGCTEGEAAASVPPSGEATVVTLPEATDDYTPPEPVYDAEDAKPDAASSIEIEPANGRLTGKVAVVTGASSGAGREVARLFAREGAKVVATARRENRLQALSEESAQYAGEIAAFKADLSDREQVKQIIQFALDTYGQIDVLVNAAGTMGSFERAGRLTEGNLDYVLAVNTVAPLLTMKWALVDMLERKSGTIINVSSIGGLNGARAGVEYTASKHALVGASRNTGYMYAKDGIRCNVICPGGIASEIMNSLTNPDPDGMEVIMNVSSLVPNDATVSDPMQIATAALFLATDSSSFFNGSILVPDGAITAC